MNRKFKVKKISAVVLGLVQVSAILMAGISTSAQAGPTIPFNDQSYLTISYDVQMEAQQRGFTSPTNSSTSSDFFLRRNRLVFNGQVNDYVGFFAQFEGGAAKTYGLNGNTDQSIFYRDAYVTLDYTDPVRFVAGRFKNVFTRENLEGCFDPPDPGSRTVAGVHPMGRKPRYRYCNVGQSCRRKIPVQDDGFQWQG
jgi:hypothetical protein